MYATAPNAWLDEYFQQEQLSVILLDANGVAIRWNHAAEALLPFEPWLHGLPKTLEPVSVSTHAQVFMQMLALPVPQELGARLLVECGLEKESTDQVFAEHFKNRDRFLSFAIHEIRNPLSAIFSWSELMQNGLLTSLEEVKEGVQIVYSESQQLSRLLDKLQLFFRIESNRQPMAFAAVRSNQLFLHLEQLTQELSLQRHITVFFEESSPEAFIWCDESLILQALQNLLENAILYSKPNEEVTVSASCSDAFWTVAIEDHAGGIAPELVPFLTEAYRLPMPRKSAQGLGLGIPTAHEIIKSHHGVLLFSPTSQGTFVKVSLPRAPAPQLS